MAKPSNNLPPAPTVSTARQDLYKVVTITLSLIIIIGSVAAVVSLLCYGPNRLFRMTVTITLLAIAIHGLQAIFTSRPPQLEA